MASKKVPPVAHGDLLDPPPPLHVPPPPGQFCTEDVDECQLQPNACHNGGTCFNTQGGHTCVCVNGWTGESCSENIDDCATAVCFNGATCHDRVASFYCACPMGKTGEGRAWVGAPVGWATSREPWGGVGTTKGASGMGRNPTMCTLAWVGHLREHPRVG